MIRRRWSSFSPWTIAPAIAVLSLMASLALLVPATAQAPDLAGSWSGGGSVSFGGGRETVRCRAHYTRTSKGSYLLSATCATPSGRASQTATLRHVGGSTFQGGFYNSEYNVSGTISVVVRGSGQTVRLSSDAGYASFELRR